MGGENGWGGVGLGGSVSPATSKGFVTGILLNALPALKGLGGFRKSLENLPYKASSLADGRLLSGCSREAFLDVLGRPCWMAVSLADAPQTSSHQSTAPSLT